MSTLKRCLNWLLRDANFQRDAYLSQATDVADLERRIHSWERQSHGLFG